LKKVFDDFSKSGEDKNGFTSVSKFKPRSKKIIGKIKMNLKQSHAANDEVRVSCTPQTHPSLHLYLVSNIAAK